MKFSVCTANYGPGSLRDAIFRSAGLGFDGVELTVAIHAPVSSTAAQRQEINAWLKDAGVACSAVHFIFEPGLELSSANPEQMQRTISYLKRVVDVCADVGARTVVVGGGGIRSVKPGQDPGQAMASLRQVIAQAAAHAQPAGISLAMEALNRYETNVIHTLAEAAAFAQSTGAPNVTTMGDTFHMNIEETSLAGAIQTYGHTLSNVHFADSNRMAPGAGHIDFAAVLRALAGVGYEGYCSFEVFAIAPGQLYLGTAAEAEAEMKRGLSYIRALDCKNE